MTEYGIAESTIATMDAEETAKVLSGAINIVPVWKWLLG